MIGKVIYNILSNDSTITDIVKTKIYPILAKENDELPIITYKSDATPFYTKSGWVYDEVKFTINNYHKTYLEAINLAQKVRTSLELKSGIYNGVTIQNILMELIVEEYDADGDAFVVSQNYITKITNQ